MKKIIEWYLTFKLGLFCLCLVIFIPFALIFPKQFLHGISGFLHRFIDDMIKYKLATEEQVKEYRDML